MNAVEIEEAVAAFSGEPFDPEAFPFAFLEAFGNRPTTIKRLRAGTTNRSDIGGVLQRSNIHIKVSPEGEAGAALAALKASPETARAKAKFVLATDGREFHAEELESGDVVVCDYHDFPDHFGFFLPLAGITTVRQIRESAFDIRATGRLNRLYVALLKLHPEWESPDRRHAMNRFMARLIFCFFAEDTGIFPAAASFTGTIEQMSTSDGSNTHEVIAELFRALNTPGEDHVAAGVPRWAVGFPYVNGGLFSAMTEVPRFDRIARSYLLHIGKLDWQKINPDIFGSMVQAVADDEERGALGMHYTSVPNILKVLNPLFLDALREQLDEAGNNGRKLLNLRNRLARIRVFDPACGSGNFLVIAYKEMRAIEAEINRRRGERERRSEIPIKNYRGIEVLDFPAEIARIALIIAEYQCDVRYLGQQEAWALVLPLDEMNWITCANALWIDWGALWPATGTTGVRRVADDLFATPLDQPEIDFENEGGETYLCGNPPYRGSTWQSKKQKADLEEAFTGRVKQWRSLDYVAGWFMKAAEYMERTRAASAFVTTNSLNQGQQAAILWPAIFATGQEIAFAHTSFKWANLASHNAGVTVSVVGMSNEAGRVRRLYSTGKGGETIQRDAGSINAYLVAGPNVIVKRASKPLTGFVSMTKGNQPTDGGHLLLTRDEVAELGLTPEQEARFIRRIYGSREFIRGESRYCLWIEDVDLDEALAIPAIRERVEGVRAMRLASRDRGANLMATRSHQFREMNIGIRSTIIVPAITSENRDYLPCGLLPPGVIISNKCYGLYDVPLWNMALIASRLHLVWIGTVCVRLEMRFSYSNTLGWHTFPVPMLTEKNRADLTASAEHILLAREAHFPATIADLYAPDGMPENLRAAHDRNDEVLERIYIGRRFRHDTERRERLFELYTKMAGSKTVA